MNNKKLKSLISLRHNIKVFVPSTINVNGNLDEGLIEEKVNRVLESFSSMFGGATSYLAMGCWTSPDAGLVKEKVTIVESFCNEPELEKEIETVIEIAESLKKEMKQEAIAVQVDNEMYFV